MDAANATHRGGRAGERDAAQDSQVSRPTTVPAPTELVSRGTPPVSPISGIPGWYPSYSLPRRPGGSRHQPHNILLLFAAQVTEGGGLSSTVSSVSRSGTVGASGAVSV